MLDFHYISVLLSPNYVSEMYYSHLSHKNLLNKKKSAIAIVTISENLKNKNRKCCKFVYLFGDFWENLRIISLQLFIPLKVCKDELMFEVTSIVEGTCGRCKTFILCYLMSSCCMSPIFFFESQISCINPIR